MPPEEIIKINKTNKWLAWSGWASVIIALVWQLGGKTIDTVLFVNKTKETNADYPEFKKAVLGKLDTFNIRSIKWDAKLDAFINAHNKYDIKRNQADIDFNKRIIEVQNER